MSPTRASRLLEQVQDESRAVDVEALAPVQQPVVARLVAEIDAVVELALLARNAGDPQG